MTSSRVPVLLNLATNETYTLSSESVSLGRAPDNMVELKEDEYVSAYHARIYWNQGWWLEDLNSSNGTQVNDELVVGPRQLMPQDIIKVGRTVFRIQ
jgi:pSer/pThr/pTyr-binding forkhead associated (FHA) protein